MERDSRDTREQRWCCPDWDQSTIDKSIRYASATSARYTDSRRKHGEDRYYAAREAQQQESPWEDEYNNGDEPQLHYIAARRNWKRPSSATEMYRKSDRRVERDRVTADRERDGRGPYYMSTGGSDGERDRRYKNSRRSKSRDSQYSEPNHSRHKTELNTTSMRRAKPHHHSKGPPSQFESDFIPDLNKKGIDGSSKDGKCMPGISSIQEEYSMEDDDSFATNDFNRTESTRNKRLSQRFSNNISCDGDNNIKKSESVNIFSREYDPFDDDFFSVQQQQEKS